MQDFLFSIKGVLGIISYPGTQRVWKRSWDGNFETSYGRHQLQLNLRFTVPVGLALCTLGQEKV